MMASIMELGQGGARTLWSQPTMTNCHLSGLLRHLSSLLTLKLIFFPAHLGAVEGAGEIHRAPP